MAKQVPQLNPDWVREARDYFKQFLKVTKFPHPRRNGGRGSEFGFVANFRFSVILDNLPPKFILGGEEMINFKGSHFEAGIILVCVRWYLAYPLSYRHVEEIMQERGIEVDHSTLNRWVLKYTPQLEQAFRNKKKPVGISWRLDETYVKVKGKWKYLYRAVDKEGLLTVNYFLTWVTIIF